MAACSEDPLCRDSIDAVLSVFRSYGYDANASEVIQKTVTEKKDYHTCSFYFIVWIAAACQ